MEHLYEKLAVHGTSGAYPLHMPGHKRNPAFREWDLPFGRDITEISGFDDLHHPRGILREEQERAARLFQTKKSYFLVNGSTCGLLAALSACVSRGGRILLARNSHKAAYHGVALRELDPVYLMPREDLWGFNADIPPAMVRKALKEEKGIEAVFVTSPTYDGVVSDIEGIARAAHEAGALLIVDEAHGAHLSFSDYFPRPATRLGADVVIESLHKTLPCLTQTAILHVCSHRVDLGRLERYLAVYQSSSPSYILMESISRCLSYLEERGEEDFARFTARLEQTRRELAGLSLVRLLEPEAFAFDRSKILLGAREAGLSGGELFRLLRDQYHLECEMEAELYCLALTSVGDTPEGLSRLLAACRQIDRDLQAEGKRGEGLPCHPYLLPERRLLPWEATESEGEFLPLWQAKGRVSKALLSLYPPGLPLLVPGEVIEEEVLEELSAFLAQGREIYGLYENQLAEVVKEDG